MYKLLVTFVIISVCTILFWDFNSETAENTNQNAEVTEGIEWIKYVPHSGKFSVLVPSQPQYAIDVVNVPKTDIKRWYEIYASEELNGTVYLINLITYHPDYDLSKPKEILHSVVEEMIASNQNNHANEIKDITWQGKPAVAFQLSNQQFEVKGEAFLENATIYLLAYTSREENFSEKEYSKFIKSFELLKDEPAKLHEKNSETTKKEVLPTELKEIEKTDE